MGDRVSISFKNGDEESPTLFSHWRGQGFVEDTKEYVRGLKAELERGGDNVILLSEPLGRLEPRTVMVDFIREITAGEKRIDSDLYLGRTPKEGDNSDNGHFTFDLKTGKVNHYPFNMEDWELGKEDAEEE